MFSRITRRGENKASIARRSAQRSAESGCPGGGRINRLRSLPQNAQATLASPSRVKASLPHDGDKASDTPPKAEVDLPDARKSRHQSRQFAPDEPLRQPLCLS